MIVRCPQCQYANQVEADATKPRIVCARCATVISIEFLSSPSGPPVSDPAAFDLPVSDSFAEGRPLSEPSFMKTPETPLDLDSLLESPADPASVSPPAPPVVMSAPPPSVESRWDTDEILDIPRASAVVEPEPDILAVEPQQTDPLAVEDLLATTPVESPTPDDFADSVLAEPPPLADSAAAANGLWGTPVDDNRDFVTTSAASFGENAPEQFAQPDYAQAAAAIEPEPLPAPAAAPPARPSVFAQDSYTRSANTYVMATPDSNNKGRLAKIFLAAALLFALLGIGYFALSGLVKDWLSARKTQQATVTPGTSETNRPGATPSAAPTTGAKTGNESGKNASASPTTVASVAASAKPTASATPASTNQNAASKPTPTPAPAQTGTSGHATGSGDGSLTIQLGAYKSSSEAQQRVAKLKSAGVEGRVVKAEVPGKGTWYRVQSGRFTSEAEASKHAGELRAKGVAQDFIVTGYQNQ
jgi:cell division septation protein DedD